MKHLHSLDTDGLYFAGKVFVLMFAIGAALPFGISYLDTKLYPPVQEAHFTEVAEVPVHTEIIQAEISSTTSQRILNKLSIADVIPPEGKFIAADLVNMKLFLYENGTTTAEYPIKLKGKAGTPWETPSGLYSVQTKEENHFSSIGKVYMPYSMQFYGNYFIHGMTYYPDGTPTSQSFSGGCIKLETADAKKVFEFADAGTKVFVYDNKLEIPPPPLSLDAAPTPPIGAEAYLVADIDTGDVYAEANAQEPRHISSVTKLMTSLVANEIISLDKHVSVAEGDLLNPSNSASSTLKSFLVGNLFYPLIMQQSNGVADALSSYYGKKFFVRWMNRTASALDMASTTFADPAGVLEENVSNTEDLFRLATYLTHKKSFVLKIAQTDTKTITSEDGYSYVIQNINMLGDIASTSAATSSPDTMLSVVTFKAGNDTRHVAVIVLDSENKAVDTKNLSEWLTASAKNTTQSASAGSTKAPAYRKIEL